MQGGCLVEASAQDEIGTHEEEVAVEEDGHGEDPVEGAPGGR